MTWDQVTIFVILALALVMFAWGKWRYDLVAVLALLAVTITGLVETEAAFLGFGHPAVVTVVAVLVVSKGLEQSGLVDLVSRRLISLGDRGTLQFFLLISMVTVTSAFINNVGSLALFLPVALRVSRETGRSPSRLLMPMAFASLLGGLTTLIGTPPNIIIATFRKDVAGTPFGMFDFSAVGVPVALVGLLVVFFLAGRLVPERRSGSEPGTLFEVAMYLTELRIPDSSEATGMLLGRLLEGSDAVVVGLVRDGHTVTEVAMFTRLAADDILIVEGDPAAIERLLEGFGLVLVGRGAGEESNIGDLKLFEAVVPPAAHIVGRTATSMRLRGRYGVNLLGVARAEERIHKRLAQVEFAVGDVLLIQGPDQAVRSAVADLGLLVLAERELTLGRSRRVVLGAGIFAAAVAATSTGLLPVEVAFSAAAAAMVLTRLITLDAAYRAVDLPIVVLLGAMLPVGAALETTGAADLVAGWVVGVAEFSSPEVVVVLLMVVVMFLSDVINNAAAAVLVAPIAIHVATAMEVSADPMLMAVAIGASMSLLTPIGHQSNLLVMAPGGYRFGDYWRLGIVVEAAVVATATVMILRVWPLAA